MRRVLLTLVCLGMFLGTAGNAVAGGPHGHHHHHHHGRGGYRPGFSFSYFGGGYYPAYRPVVVAPPPVYPYPYPYAAAYPVPAYPAYPAPPSVGFGVGTRNFGFYYNQ